MTHSLDQSRATLQARGLADCPQVTRVYPAPGHLLDSYIMAEEIRAAVLQGDRATTR